uniref:Uncharacterized protein n=1 Tax=Guillardia theta TaxID=55529 RepID=A0A6U5Y735_GUITH|mmetsp:Transcript_20560/g.68926  ORF Transcript_20560/g.68926 Transcript_20560/m.68926 type:complete len:181 (+) Transcript_20560:271-813(+)
MIQLNLQDSGCLVLNEGLAKGKCRDTLRELYLWKNGIGYQGIKHISKALSNLPKMRELNLFRNRIGDPGCSLLCRNLSEGLCKQLQILWLGDNDITKFPEDVTKMPTLQRLYLNHNKITYVPPEISKLDNLIVLDLDHNPLKGIPEGTYFLGMTKLPGPRWELLKPHFQEELQSDRSSSV